MKLPFLSLFEKKTPVEYFLALLFRDEKIHAVVFEQTNGRIQVVGEGKATLSVPVERASDEMLLDGSDKAISVAEEVLPNNITTHKTVFGVKETWVEDTHITQEYLSRLKNISQQLDLKPIGFLVFPEAIAHLLQKEEGAPVSAILVEIGKHIVTITLLRAGRIVGTKEVGVEENITETIEHALAQFENVEILPSRIILFNSADSAVEKKLLSHKWSKSLPFLHVPQITTLSPDFDTRAVLFGTATQMGFDAIDVVKQPLKKAQELLIEEKEYEEKTSEETSEEHAEEPTEKPEEKIEKEKSEAGEETVEEVTGDDTSEFFGFVKNADVAESTTPTKASPLPKHAFEDVTQEIPTEEKEEELAGSAPGFSSMGPIFVEGAKKTARQLQRFFPRQLSLEKGLNFFMGLSAKLPGNTNKLVLLIPLLLGVLLIGFLWYIFALHAKAIIFLSPKTISQSQTITFTTSGTTDPSNNTIAAQSISVDEEGKVSGDATGSKDIGNPAKGTVTIFNSDDSSHTLSKGTTITSSNNLKFTLDKDVTVASGSSDPTNLTAGTADVSITASDIGTDYNLPSNTKFSISGSSVLAAKNANALSGGTKQTVTIVSQKDIDTLTSQLTDNLKDKAKSDLSSKVSGDTVILPDFTKTTAGPVNFDKKVGDTAKAINLDGTITYETISYKKSDIENYTKSLLQDKLSSGLTLSPDGITYSVKDMATKDGTTKVTLDIKAQLIPQIDTKSLSSQISGKSFDDAKNILSSTPQFSDVTFTLSPNLFFLPKKLPSMSGNITITVVAHE